MRGLSFGSCFSGIGCFDLALRLAGMRQAWLCEIDERCRQVTAERFPDTKQYEDITKLNGGECEPVDVVLGGWPCQGLSRNGKGAGLADERSALFFDFVRVARENRARWLLGENVPGLLSVNGGQDFAAVLETITGYEAQPPGEGGGWRNAGFAWGPLAALAWRVLDAQHFGVAQQRRRVFVVALLGDFTGLAPETHWQERGGLLGLPFRVLADAEGMPFPAGEGVSPWRSAAARTGVGLPPWGRACSVPAHAAQRDGGEGEAEEDADAPPQRTVCVRGATINNRKPEGGPQSVGARYDSMYTLATAGWEHHAVLDGYGNVRKLTPVEELRLCGLPDWWLDLEKSKPLARGVRHRMVGNSGVMPVLLWIARRLAAVDAEARAAGLLGGEEVP